MNLSPTQSTQHRVHSLAEKARCDWSGPAGCLLGGGGRGRGGGRALRPFRGCLPRSTSSDLETLPAFRSGNRSVRVWSRVGPRGGGTGKAHPAVPGARQAFSRWAPRWAPRRRAPRDDGLGPGSDRLPRLLAATAARRGARVHSEARLVRALLAARTEGCPIYPGERRDRLHRPSRRASGARNRSRARGGKPPARGCGLLPTTERSCACPAREFPPERKGFSSPVPGACTFRRTRLPDVTPAPDGSFVRHVLERPVGFRGRLTQPGVS